MTSPYGSWKSPITAEMVAGASVRLGEIRIDGDDIYWIEGRPAEAGRNVIVRRRDDGSMVDVTPAGYSARTRVHEYGGGAYTVDDGEIFFSNLADGRIYRHRVGEEPRAITAEGPMRYADFIVDRRRGMLVAVREDHTVEGHEPVNTIVEIPLDGGDVRVLVSGDDFYATPRLSPDGSRLAWIHWNHPNMPWDGTMLRVATLDPSGELAGHTDVAGGRSESIFQPEWSPGGLLHFVSDRTGWWNLYRLAGEIIEPLHPAEAEFGLPQWGFAISTYAFESAWRIFCSYAERGAWRIASLDLMTGDFTPIDIGLRQPGRYLRARAGHIITDISAPDEPPSVASIAVEGGGIEILRTSFELSLDRSWISVPRRIEFPTSEGRTAYGIFYPPINSEADAPEGERPPLLVKSHGGPTSAASSGLNLGIQYWTSRGIAVLDVDYGGSTGYGRQYRQRLEGRWGIVDVEDCINGARYLADRGEVDAARLLIDGGSAGGYTTLCALTFHDVFSAGASYYGVSDLEALELETHKFESRYSQSLVAPYPERRDVYIERSPIHHVERLSTPMIFFQGLDDRVVPPNQAERMVDLLRSRGVPVAYLPFEGEEHGFRSAGNIARALEAELYFYAKVLGFDTADQIEPVAIDNLPPER